MRDPEMMVTPMEARKLFEQCTLRDLQQACALEEIFESEESNSPEWEHITLLSFLYYIGRIQGIREERYRRRKAHSMRGRGSAQN